MSRPSNEGSSGFAAVDLSDSTPDDHNSPFAQAFIDVVPPDTVVLPLQDRTVRGSRTRMPKSPVADVDHRYDEDDEEDEAYVWDLNEGEGGLLGGLKQKAKRRLKHYVRKPWVLMCGLGLVLGLIILSSVASNEAGGLAGGRKHGSSLPNITLEHVFNRTFVPRQSRFRWVTGNDGFHAVRRGQTIFIQHALDVQNDTIILEDPKEPNGEPIPFEDFAISADSQYVLIETDYERGWRHSFLANYWLWDVKAKVATRLPTSGEPGKKVALAMWSPKGNHVAWVRDNNIWVTMNAGQIDVQITTDGSADVINGIADWVYEEEVLGTHEAMWFSPSGSHVAYLKFNETFVPDYTLQYYERTKQNAYPEGVKVKYPKPGFPNPVVTLHIGTPGAPNAAAIDNFVILEPEHHFPDEDRLIVEVTWVADDSLLVRTTNRVQDQERLFLVKSENGNDTISWNGKMVREHSVADGGWITRLQPLTLVTPAPAVGRDRPSYVELKEDEKGFMHIAYFKSEDSTDSIWLTQGEWEVDTVVAVDALKGRIYFTSTEEGPTQRHLYSVLLDGTKAWLTSDDDMLPKGVAPRESDGLAPAGNAGGFYSASFSPACGFYVLSYMGPGVPWSKVYKSDGEKSRIDKDNQDLRTLLSKYSVPRTTYFQIPVSTLGAPSPIPSMNVRLTVPNNFNPNATIRYPVLLRVYGGPNSQLVQQRYQVDLSTALVSSAGFLVFTADGRETGFMGRPFRTSVASRLGTLEVADQLAAIAYLKSLPYVDPDRIAIWGWSFGGYVTAKVIEANQGVRLGMSVAPVTDWRYYDSVYTERYMKGPRMNPEGYETSRVKNPEGFANSEYLLVHGTADDNVHFQNSASLLWLLTSAHVRSYQVQVFTDSDHSITAGGASVEVFVVLWNFLTEKFVGKGLRIT